MDQELLSPEQSAELAAWWRRAFEALGSDNPKAGSGHVLAYLV